MRRARSHGSAPTRGGGGFLGFIGGCIALSIVVGASGRPAPQARLTPLAALGKALFFERALSASGRLACSSCHDPANAYGPPPGTGPVMLGGVRMDTQGLRAVPSLRYLAHVPRFTRHLYLSRTDDPEDVGPGGGLMWDGRADTLDEQALVPLLDPREMANHNVHELAARLRSSPEGRRLESLAEAAQSSQRSRLASAARLGADAQLASTARLGAGAPLTATGSRDADAQLASLAARALARFELEDPSFHPYDSRYDAYLRGTGHLTARELRGLELYNSADKGNCAECHPSAPGPGGRPPDFTDYRFAAIGVPRNSALAANADPTYYDLGLCGPLRTELARESTEYCGMFRTPTLRNAARRRSFFHNGRFTTLEQVVRFYATRDLEPARWYPVRGGQLDLYDDLPRAYRENVDRIDPPFDRRAGQPPALNEAEIADLVAFLRTLDDRS